MFKKKTHTSVITNVLFQFSFLKVAFCTSLNGNMNWVGVEVFGRCFYVYNSCVSQDHKLCHVNTSLLFLSVCVVIVSFACLLTVFDEVSMSHTQRECHLSDSVYLCCLTLPVVLHASLYISLSCTLSLSLSISLSLSLLHSLFLSLSCTLSLTPVLKNENHEKDTKNRKLPTHFSQAGSWPFHSQITSSQSHILPL